MMRRLFICMAMVIAAFVGCRRQERPVTSEKSSVKVAHWGHEKILIYLPLYVAIDGGFFDREGLIVTLKYSGNDDQVFATVIGGEAQFGVGDPTFTAISRQRGGPGKVVATLVGAVANWGVAKSKNINDIKDPKELNGLRVTSFPSPSTTFTILSEIKQTLNLEQMKIVQMAFGTEIAGLERGDADIAIMLEPQASIAEDKGFRVIWSLAEFYGPFTLTGVTTSDDMILKHPVVVQKMVNAIQLSLEYIHHNLSGAIDIAAQNFPTLDKEVVKKAVGRMVRDRTIPEEARITELAWKRTLLIRHQVGDLKSVEDGMAAVDNSFTENILKRRKSI